MNNLFTITFNIARPSTSMSYTRGYKSLHEAYSDIDWGRAEGKAYVVLDPVDPSTLEYLTPSEYRSLRKQCISNDISLTVIAHPRSDPLVNPHHNSVRNNNSDDQTTKPTGKVK
jgi:hypothetical protein